jgi:anaerobic selenocysteine-containing dehydrogenase
MRRARPTRRGRFIQAEARMSLTAASADEWLPIRPGTEGVLARAIGGLLMGSATPDAVRRYQILFPGDAPSAADAATICDVPEARIVQVAEELAASNASVVIGGGSAAAHTNGLSNVAAALGLDILLGAVGREGGVYAPSSLGLGRAIEPTNAADTPMSAVAARLRGEGEPVDLLIVADADPVHALPAGWGVRDGIARVGTVVALSSFRTDTVLNADLVLPLATELERFEGYEPATTVGPATFSLAEPVVEPLGDGLHPADILLEIARTLPEPVASRFPWADYEALVRARLGEDLARLPGSAGATATAYVSGAIDRGGIFGDALAATAPANPRGAALEPSPPVFEGAEGGFAFVLLPFESVKTGDGRGANRPWLQEHPDPMSTVMWNGWLEVSPTDAREQGIGDGDLVRVESPTGSVEVHAVIDPAVRPGVVAMPIGLGHTDYGRYAQGRGANVMALVGSTQVEGTTASAWAASRVRITRVGEGSLVRFGRRYEGGEEEVIPVGWAPMDTTRPDREARV